MSSSPTSIGRALLLVASLTLASELHAQDRTEATRMIPGKLVVQGDQGTMFQIGAVGAAHYRAHLAVASRVLAILKRDAGLATPIGYEMHLWRIAGPNEPPVSRYFPSYSGINGVLLYYYHDARAVATHGVELSSEGPGFKVLVNDPSCAIKSETISDEQGPIGTAIPRGTDYMGYPSYGEDGECIVVTTIARPLTIPVSQERWLRAQIRHRRAVLDSSRANAQADSPTAWDSSAAAAYKQWLAEAPDREAQRKAMYDQILHPAFPGAASTGDPQAQVAKLRRQFKDADSATVEGFKLAMSHGKNPELQAAQQQLNTMFAQAEQTIQSLEGELAHMSPAQRRAPAYIDIRAATPSQLVDRTASSAVALVAPNPAFLDKSLPESAAQVIVVQVGCRRIGDQAVGRFCGERGWASVDDYERILAHLDWAALRALVAGAH